MEELTIEQKKAKLYDEALEAARCIYNNMKEGGNFSGMEDLEVIFPELKESEDEKIMKALIHFISEQDGFLTAINGISVKDIITWLENQGKNNIGISEDTKKKLLDNLNNDLEKETPESWNEFLDKQGEYVKNNEDDVDIDFTVYHPLKNGKGSYESIPYSFYGTLSSFDEDKDMIDFLHLCFYTEEECNEWIKQNESTDTCDSSIINGKEFPASEKQDFGYFSKPTDKVETKFKVGDWIIQEYVGVYKVIEICKSWYEVIDDEDNHYSISFDKEGMCHLWTIADAKEGDVLISSVNKPFIYNGYFDEIIVGAYCGLYINDDFVNANKEHYWTNNVNIRPATKEQGDILFKKMKENGYEWDSEKKEAIRILTKKQ